MRHDDPVGVIKLRRRSARPRVAIIRQNYIYEPMVQREAEALAGAGFDVEVMCMRDASRPPRTVVNGVRVISLPVSQRKGSKVRYALNYARFFGLAAGTLTARHIRRPYAVVQANSMPDFLVFAALVPKLLGSRVIAYMHEPSPELAETVFGPGLVTAALARIEQWSLRFADHAITVTEQLKQRYVERGARAGKISVVLNCPDPALMLADWTPPADADRVDTGGFTLVCHGSVEDRYGQDTIIDALALLRDELPDLRLVLTGRGTKIPELLDHIAAAGLGDVVNFVGWVSVSELNDILHAADAGIVAQKASPYSHLVQTNKMVDYWIFGLPVIASRLRSVSEIYGDDVLEYFQAGDPADLAAAIRRLHGDPARRAQLAEGGQRAQRENGWATQQGVYLGVFDRLLGPAGSGPADAIAVDRTPTSVPSGAPGTRPRKG
jgi:glycosyltransferase involved in cell wall biosynthesis